MPPTLEFVTDPKMFPETGEYGESGYRIIRHGKIAANDVASALKAQGVPARGSPFGIDFPDMVFRGMTVEGLGGKPNGDNTGCWYKARLEWATKGYGQSRPTAPGDSWTELAVNVSSLNVNFAVSGYWQDTPLNNGEGVQIETGQAIAIVHVFQEEANFNIPITRLLGLCSPNKLNADNLNLPPILGSGTTLDFAPGQVRYRTFALAAKDGVLEIQHHLVLSPDHLARWGVKNKEGQRLGDAIPADVYGTENMGGLW